MKDFDKSGYLREEHPQSPAYLFIKLFAGSDANRIFCSEQPTYLQAIQEYCHKKGLRNHYQYTYAVTTLIEAFEWIEGKHGLKLLVMNGKQTSSPFRKGLDPPFFYVILFDADMNPLAHDCGPTHQVIGDKPWQQGKPFDSNPIDRMKDLMEEKSELTRITTAKPFWE